MKLYKQKFFLFSLLIFFIGVFSYGTFMLNNFTQASNNIFSSQGNKATVRSTISEFTKKADESILNGFSEGRINVLLLGIAGEDTKKQGALLTDTVMVASIDVVSHRVALMSLPRDLLVETDGGLNRLNAFYSIGQEQKTGANEIKDAIEQITDQTMHYYIVMDFAGFTKTVDALGGINIDIPRAINDPLYPGPGYSYEPFVIREGFQKLDGQTALKYVRSRHDDPQSDFGRAKRQQQVLRAIRNKTLSLGTLTNPFRMSELFTVLGNHLKTDIQTSEVHAFNALLKKVDTQNITTVVVDAWKQDSLLQSIKKTTPVGTVVGLWPRNGDWDEINEYAKEIFTLENITLRRDAIVAEKPKVILQNASGENIIANRIRKSLIGLGFRDIEIETRGDTRPTSVVTDFTAGQKPFALNEIVSHITTNIQEPNEELLDQQLQSSNNELGQTLLIILGEDLAIKYAYEEATRELVEKDYKPLPPK